MTNEQYAEYLEACKERNKELSDSVKNKRDWDDIDRWATRGDLEDVNDYRFDDTSQVPCIDPFTRSIYVRKRRI